MATEELKFILKMRDQASRVVKKNAGAFRGLGKDINKTKAQGVAFTQTLGKMRKSLLNVRTALLSVGAIAGFSRVIRGTLDFDKSLTRVTALTIATSEEVKGFREEILKTASALGKSPQELSEGLFVVSSAGLRGEAAMRGLTAAAKASAAGLGEIADIARVTSAVIFTYGSAMITAEEATAILVNTAKEGNFEISQLAGSLGNILPFAKEMGVSFGEVGAAIAVLTKGGVAANRAILALRATFVALIRSGPQGELILRSLGSSFSDIKKIIKDEGLLAGLRELDEVLEGDTTALQRVLQNAEAVGPVLQLMGAEAKEVDRIFRVLAGTTSEDLERAFGTTAKDAAFTLTKAMVQLNVQMIRLGDVAAPAVVKAAKFMGDNFESVTTAVKALSIAVLTFVSARVLGALISGIAAMRIAFLATAGSAAVLSSVLAATPWGIVAALVAAAAGALIFYTSKVELTTEQIIAQKDSLVDIIKALKEANALSGLAAISALREADARRRATLEIRQQQLILAEARVKDAREVDARRRRFLKIRGLTEAEFIEARAIFKAAGEDVFKFQELVANRIAITGKKGIEATFLAAFDLFAGEKFTRQSEKSVRDLQAKVDGLIAAGFKITDPAKFDPKTLGSTEDDTELAIIQERQKAIGSFFLTLEKGGISRRKELELIGLTTAAEAKLSAERRIMGAVEDLIREKNIEGDQEDNIRFIANLKAEFAGEEALAIVRAKAAVTFKKKLMAMEDEARLIGLSGRAQARLRTEIQLTRLIKQGVIKDDGIANAQLARANELLDIAIAKTRTAAAGWKKFWEDYRKNAENEAAQVEQFLGSTIRNIEGAFQSFFDGQVRNWKDLRSTISNLLSSIASEIARTFLIKPLVGFLGKAVGLTSAQGNAFEHGRKVVTKFAKGGVVGQPGSFPLKGGFGTVAEEGAEAILPLKRGKSGNLGVEATGLSGGMLNYGPTFNISLGGGSGGGGGPSPEVMGQLAALLDKQTRQTIMEVLQNEQRPGGLLSRGVFA